MSIMLRPDHDAHRCVLVQSVGQKLLGPHVPERDVPEDLQYCILLIRPFCVDLAARALLRAVHIEEKDAMCHKRTFTYQ